MMRRIDVLIEVPAVFFSFLENNFFSSKNIITIPLCCDFACFCTQLYIYGLDKDYCLYGYMLN